MTHPSVPKSAFQPHSLLWWGLGVLIVGTGPLLLTLLAAKAGWLKDPNPNPVGFGMLAFVTFWPGVGMIVGGSVLTLVRWLQSNVARRKPR